MFIGGQKKISILNSVLSIFGYRAIKKTYHRLRPNPWQSSRFPVTVQHLKCHKSTIYMARRFTALVGLSTHTHLHARVHRECGFMQRYALRQMDNRTFLRLFSL